MDTTRPTHPPLPAIDPVTARISANVRALRARLGLSLEALSTACGVSRSALSLIERGESSPTAVVLDRVATGLRVPLSVLFDEPGAGPPAPIARRADQPVWRDPASGYVRRAVTPAGVGAPFDIVEVRFPPGARVAFETGVRSAAVHQQIWVLEGTIEFTYGDEAHTLGPGDCMALELDRPVMFHNATARAARYAVIVTVGAVARPAHAAPGPTPTPGEGGSRR